MLDIPVAVTPTTEGTGREASVDTQPRHATRSTRNGRADVNYSQKYHPMDEVTRPKRAQRITGSRAPSSFADTSDEEEPGLFSGESTDADEPSEASDTPATRTLDPRAVRHSSRAEAQKQVNYSRTHHPQDWAILGRRRSTKRKRRDLSPARPQKKSKGRASSHASPIVLSSDKTSDNDSDSDEDEDEPPINNVTATDAASPARSQADGPDTHRSDSNGTDAQPPVSDRVPQLPRDESSLNPVDAIIQGSHISRNHPAIERYEPEEPTNDGQATGFATASTRQIGHAMGALIDSIATPDTANSDTAGADHTIPDEPVFAAPPATMPMALVTPSPMDVPTRSCNLAKTQLAINRPHMATQPKHAKDDDDVQQPDQTELPSECSPEVVIASAQSTTSSDPAEAKVENISPEKKQQDAFSDASRQAMRDASEGPARTARAMEVTNQLSFGNPSQNHTTSKSSNTGTPSVSRQVSRDTLPDDPGSSYFDEAMVGTQSHSQRERDEVSQEPFMGGYSQLPVSERERSDASASQEQSSSDGPYSRDASDGIARHISTGTLKIAQPEDNDQVVQQQLKSPVTLGRSTGTDDQGDVAGQASAVTSSQDSTLLKPSSAL